MTKTPDQMLAVLEARFARHMQRHKDIPWADVRARLESRPDALRVLSMMEESGGEPDVVGRDAATGRIAFCDCAPESPGGRRSVCFDRAALDARKEHKPKASAEEMAREMGVELLTEEQYRGLQALGEF